MIDDALMRACTSPILATVLATACTHHHPVTTLLPISPSAEATAQLGNGRDVDVRAEPTPTGARWIAQGEPLPGGVVVESADMRSYTTVSRGRGAAEGLALGGLGGAALGAVIGLASGDDKCAERGFCILLFSARDKAILGGIAFGGLGLALGGLLGALVGSRDVYEIDSAYVPRLSTTIAPGRAGGGLTWSF
jgi:hypothetical protein